MRPFEQSAGRVPGLDLLRALAIAAVMLYHLTIFGELPARLLPVAWYGWMGVDLFVVLSGYLIGAQLLRPYSRDGSGSSIVRFYRRRAYRILPAYLVVVAIYFLVPAFREYPRLEPLWRYLSFTMNLGYRPDQRCFSNAWSLCVEEHFYCVLPLLIAWLMRRPSARRGWTVFGLVVGWGIALRWWLLVRHPGAVFPDIYYPTWTRLDGLAVGVGLAALQIFRPAAWQALTRSRTLLPLAGVSCVAFVVWMFRGRDLGSATGAAGWGTVLGFPLLAAGLGLLTASSVRRDGWLNRVRVPGAETLAALAFTLYLTHKPVAHLVMVRLPAVTRGQGPASWALYAATCLLAAWLLHMAVERPVLRLRDKRLRGTPGAVLEAQMLRDPPL